MQTHTHTHTLILKTRQTALLIQLRRSISHNPARWLSLITADNGYTCWRNPDNLCNLPAEWIPVNTSSDGCGSVPSTGRDRHTHIRLYTRVHTYAYTYTETRHTVLGWVHYLCLMFLRSHTVVELRVYSVLYIEKCFRILILISNSTKHAHTGTQIQTQTYSSTLNASPPHTLTLKGIQNCYKIVPLTCDLF